MLMSRALARVVFCAVVLALLWSQGHALEVLIDPRASTNLAGAEGLPGDRFGHSLALDGDTLVLSAPADIVGKRTVAGSAYVYVRTSGTWSLQAKLPAPPGLQGALGNVVALSADQIALSEQAQNRVHLYARTAGVWTLQSSLSFTSSSTQSLADLVLDGNTLALSQSSVETSPEQGRGLVLVFVRSGSNWTEQARLQLPATAFTNDFFGWSLALSGDRLLIGAREDAQGGSSTGAAYIYERSGSAWSQVKRLVASDASVGASFGSAVALAGDTVAVGAPGRSSTSGASQAAGGVYVFTRGSGDWSQSARLEATANAAGLGLGSALELKSGLLLAGALAQDIGVSGEQLGAAFVFEGSGASWVQRQRFDAPATSVSDFARQLALHNDGSVLLGSPTEFVPDLAPGGAVRSWQRNGASWTAAQTLDAGQGVGYREFGAAVALDGNTAVVGTPGSNPLRILRAGETYVLARPSAAAAWTVQATLAEPGQFGDFGQRVALQGDTLLSAAPFYSQTAGNPVSGTVVVRVRQGNNWIEQARLTGDPTTPDLQFGRAVALSGNTAAIAAFSPDPTKGLDDGAVYLFTRQGTNWTRQARLTPPRSGLAAGFGSALALDGDRLLVGAPGDRPPATASFGAAFVYLRSGSNWVLDSTLLPQEAVESPDFGRAVALLGDRALVAAPLGHGAGPGAGSGVVYTYLRSAGLWSEQSPLAVAGSSRYGKALALSTAQLLVSGDNPDGFVDVYALVAGQWLSQRRILAPAAGERFGHALASSGTDLLIGAPLHALNTVFANPQTGAVYFEGDTLLRDGFE